MILLCVPQHLKGWETLDYDLIFGNLFSYIVFKYVNICDEAIQYDCKKQMSERKK